MKGELIVYKPGHPTPVLSRALTVAPSLEELQAELDGGSIEVVPYLTTIERGGKRVPCVAFCDEEGKLKQLQRNNAAQALWRAAVHSDSALADVLVGPVVVVIGDDELLADL